MKKVTLKLLRMLLTLDALPLLILLAGAAYLCWQTSGAHWLASMPSP